MEKQIMNQAKIMEEAKSSLLAIHDQTQTKSHKDPSFKRKLIIIGFVLPFTLLAIGANQALKKVGEGITHKLYLLHENPADGKTLTMAADGISNDVRLLIGLQLLIFLLSRLTLLFVFVDTAYYFAETYSEEQLNVKELFLKIGRIRERPVISCLYIILFFSFLAVFSGILFGIMLGLAEGVSSIMSLKVES